MILSLLTQRECQSKVCFLLAQRAIQRRSLDEIAEEQVRRVQIRRRSLDEILWLNPAGCWIWPVYIGGQIQGGPGQIGILNCDWLSAWDAVDAVSAGRSGDASPGHASQTQVTRLFQASFQSPWKANYDWLLAQSASPSFSAAVISLEACGVLPGLADFLCREF